MRILVIEDYPAIARSIARHLRALLGERVQSLDVVPDVAAGRRKLEEGNVDLLLLDLNLGGKDGFEVLPWATAGGCHVVVVSANTHRALEAFEHGVLDFVPKPVDPARLRLAIERFDGVAEREPRRTLRLAVGERKGYELIDVDRVRRIQAAGKYSELHLVDGPPRIHGKSLERLAALLPDRFLRVHRSHVVNLDCVLRLEVQSGATYRLELDDGSTVPVGRTRYAELRDRLA